MSGRDDKAQRYIELLDTARNNANWAELPELIRKVTKHAPQRKCLSKTATLEYELSKITTARAPNAGESAIPSERIASLAGELKGLEHDSDDEIQGRACLLWAEWSNLEIAKISVPDSATAIPTAERKKTGTPWTNTCIVKAAYIRGQLLNAKKEGTRAHAAYRSILPWLDANGAIVGSNPQLSYWTEQLLAKLAIVESQNQETRHSALMLFRRWALVSGKTKPSPPSLYGHVGPYQSRLSVWKTYYQSVSLALREETYPEIGRAEQAAELRKVQTAYENELLRSTQFPKANQSNAPVEDWVEQVISNWQLLCSPRWQDSELGEGGRNSVTRNVIDILYRAATKTFHSTLILRRLFQVHNSIADFDLAYKALDTYLELIDRGRARAEKSHDQPQGQDSDELVLRTMSEGIEALCSYGRQPRAEKAYDLCLKLEAMYVKIERSMQTQSGLTNGALEVDVTNVSSLSPETRELVQRALGVGKAHWAIWTPFNERRSMLQEQALIHLRTAVELPLANEQKLSSSYALGLLLAQTRDVDAAIESVKIALSAEPSKDTQAHMNERKLVPLWHLLALLLTARQDFDTAGQSCAAAFEQFDSSKTLFGDSLLPQKPSEKQNSVIHTGLVDDMECAELQRIVEVRLTELSLTDLIEGPEHAVNSSNELLTLYSRLFKRFGVAPEEKLSQTRLVEPPKSSAGTVKSLRGSIFRRKKLTSTSDVFNEKITETPSTTTNASRPTTQNTQAPTIRVTDEDEKSASHKHRLFRRSLDSARHVKRSSSQTRTPTKLIRSQPSKDTPNLQPRTAPSVASTRQSFETTQEQGAPSSTDTTETAQAHLETIQSVEEVPTNEPSTDHNQDTSTKQSLGPITHQVADHSSAPPPVQHDEQPPIQDTRLPNPPHPYLTPTTRFTRPSQQRHALTILVSIWLTIARLYRRATLFEDSREATDEAAKASLRIESLIASVESSARAFADPGWGGAGKSSDQVWADVYCERAELQLAIAKAKGEKAQEEEATTGIVDDEGVREAVELWEQCLMYYPDHAGGIVGLSNVLLDYYERKVELARRVDDGTRTKIQSEMVEDRLARERRVRRQEHDHVSTESSTSNGTVHGSNLASAAPVVPSDDDLKKTPENLNRLAARDRAYGLLSSLTKLGNGWDDADAWFALARAHELGGEIEKAKEILWWVIELEESKPLRDWGCIGCTGYVL